MEPEDTTPVADAAARLGMTPSQVHFLVRRGDLELSQAESGLFEVTASSLRRFRQRSTSPPIPTRLEPTATLVAAAAMLDLTEAEVRRLLADGALQSAPSRISVAPEVTLRSIDDYARKNDPSPH